MNLVVKLGAPNPPLKARTNNMKFGKVLGRFYLDIVLVEEEEEAQDDSTTSPAPQKDHFQQFSLFQVQAESKVCGKVLCISSSFR